MLQWVTVGCASENEIGDRLSYVVTYYEGITGDTLHCCKCYVKANNEHADIQHYNPNLESKYFMYVDVIKVIMVGQ
jgi:hypothetical protein